MPRNLDTALLRSFVAVVETGGMTRAAGQLHLTQAAVSQQIRRLEECFGTALVSRDRAGLQPTAAGERLLGRAQRLLALNDEIWATMTAPEVEGEVRCGVPHDVVAAFMPPILKAFDRSRPAVRVSIVTATTRLLRAAMARGELDLLIGTELEVGQGGEVLFTDRLLWVGAKGGTAYRREPLPISFDDPTCAFRRPALEAIAASGRNWRSAFATSDMLGVIAGVEADLTVAVMLASTVPPTLEVIAAEAGLPPLPSFHVTLYVPRTGASAATYELAGLLRQKLSPSRLAA
jgi:DNA-binding transcriptional LysR family regulator